MTTRPYVSFGTFLILWLALLASVPQAVSAQAQATPTPAGSPSTNQSVATPAGPDGETGATPHTTKEKLAGSEKQLAAANERIKNLTAALANSETATVAPVEKKSVISTILNAVGLGLASLSAVGALVFAVLAWRGTTRLQDKAKQGEQQVPETFHKLLTQIPAAIGADLKAQQKSFSTGLERISQNMTDTAAQAIRSAVAQSQAAVPNIPQFPPDGREGSSPSGATADLTNKLDQVTRSNTAILAAVQSLRPQPAPPPQSTPQAPSLSSLIGQAADPNDALAKSGQRLQATFQKLAAGSRDGDSFLDSLAQTVFVPLSVPLAPANLTEAQVNHRISLLGAIERTRMQAAALARGMGLEIIPVEVRKTPFDGNRHDAMLGTEIQTDRAELSGKVAEVLDHGFLQKSRDNSIRVLRKARVRLYLQAQPKPAVAPPAAAPPTVMPAAPEAVAEQNVVSEAEPAARTPAPAPGPVNVAAEGADDVRAAQQQIESYRGTNSASLSHPEWQDVAASLTVLYQSRGLDAAALNVVLADVFADNSPQCLLPQLGEATKPLYEVSTPPSSGCVAAVLRVGIELPSDGTPNRPVTPLVRLGPSQESSQL